jgi:hypothetical protein
VFSIEAPKLYSLLLLLHKLHTWKLKGILKIAYGLQLLAEIALSSMHVQSVMSRDRMRSFAYFFVLRSRSPMKQTFLAMLLLNLVQYKSKILKGATNFGFTNYSECKVVAVPVASK